MNLFVDNKDYLIYNDDMTNLESDIASNSVDAIVTDPPYELSFMGKSWDSAGVSFQKSTWIHCYNVLKPGGYLLAFGGSRTFHRIACAIEDAGFEIRDTIMWIYGSGMPKSMNLGLAIDKHNGVESKVIGTVNAPDFQDSGKQVKESIGIDKRSFGQAENVKRKFVEIKEAQNAWNGWGSTLKPAYEPIVVARKPFRGSLVENVLEYGVGGINIDDCRVPFENTKNAATNPLYRKHGGYSTTTGYKKYDSVTNFDTSHNEVSDRGRFPANVILSYDETDYDEVCEGFPSRTSPNGSILNDYYQSTGDSNIYSKYGDVVPHFESYGDSGSASRYFYCAKASKRDRNDGLIGKKNIHVAVKPTSLMQYLVRLVAPKGATVLDPFMGSGSTGKAVMYENLDRNAGYKFIGIELDAEYCEIANERISYVTGGGVPLISDTNDRSETSAPNTNDVKQKKIKKLF